MSKSIPLKLSSHNFIVSSLTFRSLIHFEDFLFFFFGVCVYDSTEYSKFILLHVPVQFSQQYLLKRITLLCIFLSSLLDYTILKITSNCKIMKNRAGRNYGGNQKSILDFSLVQIEIRKKTSLIHYVSSVSKESACKKTKKSGSIPGLERSTGDRIGYPLQYTWASLVAQLVKNPPAIRETSFQS